jgi:hypothetical protein
VTFYGFWSLLVPSRLQLRLKTGGPPIIKLFGTSLFSWRIAVLPKSLTTSLPTRR